MKFYFAGAFGRKTELAQCADILEEEGTHQCTSRWLRTAHEADVTEQHQFVYGGLAHRFADEDIEDMQEAEGFVAFSSSNHNIKGRGGRHTEFGMAIVFNHIRKLDGHGYPIALIGQPEHAFHAMVPPEMRFVNFYSFMDEVDSIEKEWLVRR